MSKTSLKLVALRINSHFDVRFVDKNSDKMPNSILYKAFSKEELLWLM